jgi:hypothetical protein
MEIKKTNQKGKTKKNKANKQKGKKKNHKKKNLQVKILNLVHQMPTLRCLPIEMPKRQQIKVW